MPYEISDQRSALVQKLLVTADRLIRSVCAKDISFCAQWDVRNWLADMDQLKSDCAATVQEEKQDATIRRIVREELAKQKENTNG